MICRASHILVDAILNHPSVRPTADCAVGRLSSYQLFKRGCVAYADDKGCALLFLPHGDDVWEGHAFAVEGSRGGNALRFGKLAIDRLFTDCRARRLVAEAPLQLPAVQVYCRRLGLRPVSKDDLIEYFAVEKDQWAELSRA